MQSNPNTAPVFCHCSWCWQIKILTNKELGGGGGWRCIGRKAATSAET